MCWTHASGSKWAGRRSSGLSSARYCFIRGRVLGGDRFLEALRYSRLGNPMPLGFRLNPAGMAENSPAFQGWVEAPKDLQVPAGTTESTEDFCRPSGTRAPMPNLTQP